MAIDVIALARSQGGSQGHPGGHLEGRLAVARLSRLVQGLPAQQPGCVEWHLAGRTHAGRALLDVRAHGAVSVVCQRCLQPFDLELDVSRTLGFVSDEAELAALDALEAAGGGDGIEYLVADPHLDVQDLLEDELILALPFAPRHEACPAMGTGVAAAGDAPGAVSPFAALASIRKH